MATAVGSPGRGRARVSGHRVLLNGAFRSQRVTGQQRYASEVSDALQRLDPGRYAEARPRRGGSARAWLWALSLPLRTARGRGILTMTSRGPVWSRRQAVVVHDLFVLEHPEWYTLRYRLSHAVLLAAQLRSADLLLAVSEPVARSVERRVGPGTAVAVAPNAPAAVFLDEPGEAHGLTVARRGLRPAGYFLAVGSADPRKNFPRLVAAWSRLPDEVRAAHPLVLVGGANTSVFRQESERPSDDAAPIRLLDVSDRELAALYGAATAVVFPSLDEGFGLPAIEALACGARTLVSDIPVLRWVCRDHAAYFDPTDAASIAAAMLAAAGEPDDAGSRAERRAYARSRFSWEDTARRIDHALRMVEGGR